MDLCITGLEFDGSKENEWLNLAKLGEQIFKHIDKEIIIKKTEILDTEFPLIKIEFSIEEINKKYELNEVDHSVKSINVDITIDLNGNHYGIKVWDFVKQKLWEAPYLKPVCLYLKNLLWFYDMNIPYKGGLGSYPLFVMLLHIEKYVTTIFPFKEFMIPWIFTIFLSYFGNFENIKRYYIDPNSNKIPWFDYEE